MTRWTKEGPRDSATLWTQELSPQAAAPWRTGWSFHVTRTVTEDFCGTINMPRSLATYFKASFDLTKIPVLVTNVDGCLGFVMIQKFNLTAIYSGELKMNKRWSLLFQLLRQQRQHP